MPRFEKPAEGSWTEHYPELGTGPVSYHDCISPEFHEEEAEAVFGRAWLLMGRVEDVPAVGSFVTREIEVLKSSIIIVRGQDDRIRAFHNFCRHRGNKILWNHSPHEQAQGTCRAFTCKYHGWRYGLDGSLEFVQQEDQFFDLDKRQHGLVPVHCDTWGGFVFVNLAEEPEQSLADYLGPTLGALGDYPFHLMTERYEYRADIRCNWKIYCDASQEFYHAPILHSQEATPATRARGQEMGFEAPYYQLEGPHRLVSTVGAPRRLWPEEYRYLMETAFRSGLMGPWDAPDLGPEPPGVNPGGLRKWEMTNFQIFPNVQLLVQETGWYILYRYWPTGYNTHRFEAWHAFTPSTKASERAARECSAVMNKDFTLQDAATLEGTQRALESRRSRETFPLCDQEVLVRHLHKTVGDWVEDWRAKRAGGGQHG